MNKRDFITGLLATAFVASVPFKAMAKVTTSVSPPIRKVFHRYDSVAMTYIKEVLGRTTPLPIIRNVDGIPLRREAWGRKPNEKYDPDATIDYYTRPVPPDLAKSAFFIEHDKQARQYFSTLPAATYPLKTPLVTSRVD